MTDQYETNLDEASRLVAETLASAKAELAQLEVRQAQLVALIARTEAMRRSLNSEPPPDRQMTLHEALAFLLEESSNRWMTIKELSVALNKRALYRKKDGSPVEINQLHARINNYSHLFEKDGARVRLHTVLNVGDPR